MADDTPVTPQDIRRYVQRMMNRASYDRDRHPPEHVLAREAQRDLAVWDSVLRMAEGEIARVQDTPHAHCWHSGTLPASPVEIERGAACAGVVWWTCCDCGMQYMQRWRYDERTIPRHGPHVRQWVVVYGEEPPARGARPASSSSTQPSPSGRHSATAKPSS